MKPLEQRLLERPQRRPVTVLVAHGAVPLAAIEAVVARAGVATQRGAAPSGRA
jgi:hypothetical protein